MFSVADGQPHRATKPRRAEDFRIVLDEVFARGEAGFGNFEMISGDFQIRPQPIDPVSLFMVSVVAQLVKNIGCDQDTSGDADGQSNDVYKGKGFVFPQVDKSDLNIVFKHDNLHMEL